MTLLVGICGTFGFTQIVAQATGKSVPFMLIGAFALISLVGGFVVGEMIWRINKFIDS